MKYDSTEFNGGVTRPLEIKFELDDNYIKTTILNKTDEVHSGFKIGKEIYNITVKSFVHKGAGKDSNQKLNRFFLIDCGCSYWQKYDTNQEARQQFDVFVNVITYIRIKYPEFGNQDIKSYFKKDNPSQERTGNMTTYRSKDFCPVGVTRPLEIEITLDESLGQISFRTETMSDDVHNYFYTNRIFNNGGQEILIESFNSPPDLNVSKENLNKIPLFKSQYYSRKKTKQYPRGADAYAMFKSFIRVIKQLRIDNAMFGPADVENKNKSVTQPKTTNNENKESLMNTNLTQIGTEVLSDNKEFAIFEAERATGLAALDALEKKMTEAYPGTESFWKSKLGTFILCNGIHAAGKVYDGPQSNVVHETTKIIMRGAYAKVGDSVNLNGFIESVFESVISVVPGMSKKTSGTSDATETK
jgi:hypothetical protein